MRFDGKVAIVTGGARGMGAAHARGLAAEGARVAVCDLLDDEGKALAESLPGARYHHLDVTDEEAWQSVVRTVEDTLGPVDILVNNAGIVHFGGVEEQSPEHFRRILDVNVVGTFLGMHTVLPGMRGRGRGAVVNISSAMRPHGLRRRHRLRDEQVGDPRNDQGRRTGHGGHRGARQLRTPGRHPHVHG